MNDRSYLRIKSKVKLYFAFGVLYLIFFLLPFFERKKNWLFCERGNDAQNNVFIFYKYVFENHKYIKPVLIHKSSSDFKNVSNIGKVVEFGSVKHFLMMIGYPVEINSRLFGYSPWENSTLYYRGNKTRHKYIFLQHGVINNLHESFLKRFAKV